eukprot:CAMPEP_0180425318 /NCGR_PEP_ID=MMETSP1036_2-20121128/5202_1 /TAXON_ID=632150 /ORGANISM="Azadinium spinosum, Strain 3D9" /LENGTH=43 /DNA_ID= /DNA_START= /DNA_END= /DNA_ORIENTATION=
MTALATTVGCGQNQKGAGKTKAAMGAMLANEPSIVDCSALSNP